MAEVSKQHVNNNMSGVIKSYSCLMKLKHFHKFCILEYGRQIILITPAAKYSFLLKTICECCMGVDMGNIKINNSSVFSAI